ncbi:hypothetical protein D3C86_1595120 [compost metagenome]
MPAVGATVADMRQGEAPATQHQGGEGGQQRLTAPIGLQPAVMRDQQAIQRLRHCPGLRGGVVVQGQCLQGRSGGQAAVGALADTVGQGEQVAFARRQGRGWRHHANGVLVLWARAGGAGFAEGELQGHGGFS